MISILTRAYFAFADALHLADAPNVPDPQPSAPGKLGEASNAFIAWLKWGGMVVGVAGVIICGVMMMVGRRNRSHLAVEGASGLMWVGMGLSIVVLSASLVTTIWTAVS